MTAAAPRVTPRPPRLRRAPGSTLGGAYDPRHNAFDVLRLVFAVAVAVTHAFQLTLGWQPTLGNVQVGALAVDGFFVLSGFLVAASWIRLESLPRFVWHRFLRIMPAYWAWLLVTVAVVVPLLGVMTGTDVAALYTGPDSAVTYLWRNALLFSGQFGVGGLPDTLAGGDVLNGARWTLFYEALCYAALAALGVLGVLRARPWLLVAAVAALQVGVTAEAVTGADLLPGERLQRLLLMFLLGALGYVLADRVRLGLAPTLVAAASVVAATMVLEEFHAVGAVGFAYLVLLAAVRLPWKPRIRTDLSYGTYLWHWPVAVVLLSTPLAGAPFVVVLTAVLVGSGLVALASWHLVEAPALRLKGARLPRRPTT